MAMKIGFLDKMITIRQLNHFHLSSYINDYTVYGCRYGAEFDP